MTGGKLLFLRQDQKLLTLLINQNRLHSVQVYEEENISLVGNIYIGKVQSIAENIQAAFVEIADKKLCFLSFLDVKNPLVFNRKFDGKLHVGDELIVQVIRDAMKTKQPAVTTKISLAGSYVAVENSSSKLGISGKLPEKKRKEIMEFLTLHAGNDFTFGAVVRTNAGTLTEYTPLLKEWKMLKEELAQILSAAPHRTCFTCLRQNQKPYLTDLKNYYIKEYEEIVTDCADLYEELTQYAETEKASSGLVLPAIRFYQDSYPLEKLYSIKTNLKMATESRVWLKSGGYLIIEPTEALTVIDVNTGKYEAKKHNEEAYYTINMEAAEEIALQLKLRNLSGIIIVDFINMTLKEHNEELLSRLTSLVQKDSVKTTVVDMTPLGLVEITRKKISKPLRELL